MGSGNEHRNLHLAGGVDNAPDQVKRRNAFVARHPEIVITSPRQNGTGEHQASWAQPGDLPPGDDAVIEGAHHAELRFLLDYLEARFDNGTMERPGRERIHEARPYPDRGAIHPLPRGWDCTGKLARQLPPVTSSTAE